MLTKDKLKKIILEWASFTLPAFTARDFDERFLNGDEILTVVGARRSGKTFLCYQMIHGLRKSTPKANILYINLEDERLCPLGGEELSMLWDVYQELLPLVPGEKIYLFLDEIQNAAHWSKWARRITDQHRNLKLILTGSSSRMLSREIATELRGRTRTFTMWPLGFGEYLRAKSVHVDTQKILHSPERPLVKRHFNAYQKLGGFPALLDNDHPEELLKEYYRVMFYRDLVERHKIKSIRLLEDFLALMVDQVACLATVSATATKLQQIGHSFSKNTLTAFLRYAEDVFLLFALKKYSYKMREQLRAPRKIYAIDHGLVGAIRFGFSEDYGRMLENIVFVALMRKGDTLHYHRGNRECDFIVSDRGRPQQAIQVTKTLSDAKTREREIAGLLEAMQTYRLSEGLILTEDTSEMIKTQGKHIVVQPVWQWLLR